MLPRVARYHFLGTLLVEEIHSTNEIENVQSSRQEVAEALDTATHNDNSTPPKRFHEMVSTFKLLIQKDDSQDSEFPQTLEGLRALYDQLLVAEVTKDNQPDGELFRAGPVYITDGSNSAVHKGVYGEDKIKSCLSVMLDASTDDSRPWLVSAFMAHFMVEHTHPFYDGNGRFGRFLLALKLRQILSAPTALSLSAQVRKQKDKYYKAFAHVENPLNRGEATFFVNDMLAMLLAAQNDLEEQLRVRWRSLRSLEERIDTLKKTEKDLGDYQIATLFMLGQVLLFGPRNGVTLDEVADFLERSKQTVRPVLKSLTDKGLIEAVNKRPLVFTLTEQGEKLLDLRKLL